MLATAITASQAYPDGAAARAGDYLSLFAPQRGVARVEAAAAAPRWSTSGCPEFERSSRQQPVARRAPAFAGAALAPIRWLRPRLLAASRGVRPRSTGYRTRFVR